MKAMAIRVMHVVDSLETGGLERGVVNIIQRLDPTRFQHTVCAIRNLGPLADQLPRTQVTCLNRNPKGFSIMIGELARQIKRARPHVVHSRNWGTIEAVWAGRLARQCRVVHSEHGSEAAEGPPEPRLKWIVRRAAYEFADQVMSVSHQLKEMWAARTGFAASRIQVIHNGVDTSRFRPRAAAREAMRREFSLGENEVCIGVIGRLEPVKDYATLLRAAATLKIRPEWKLLVVGLGQMEAALKKFAAENPNLHDRVRFLGERTEIPDILNALDIYVLPSLSEGISNSLLEAMATGLPVVVSDTGGNPEVVAAGQSGMLFKVGHHEELASHLTRLIEEPEERARFGRQARERIEREDFSLDAMAERYARMYSRLAGAGL